MDIRRFHKHPAVPEFLPPKPDLLDRFLLMMEQQNVPTLICFNKEDLASEAEIQELRDAYGTCGYPLFFVSARQQEGIDRCGQHWKEKQLLWQDLPVWENLR